MAKDAFRTLVTAVLLLVISSHALAGEWDLSGYVSVEPRVFPERPLFPEQSKDLVSWSGVLAPEFRYEWGEGANRLTIAPFLRIDQHDRERTHADLRDASWQHVSGPWTIVAGMSKVFWGVAESRHLVDIINQTDLVEDIRAQERLGQPMIRVERWTEVGTFGAFLLPGFRERTFPDDDARLRSALPIATDRAVYESGAGNRRVDFALRWAHALGPWDLGLSMFHGTSREPRLVPSPISPTQIALVPHYDVITQTGVDMQYTRGAWLWKLETIFRNGHGTQFAAAVGGFEHTFFGFGGSAIDLGVLAEYHYDGRSAQAPPTIQDDDVFVGVRLMFNDPDGTALLAGVLVDRDSAASFAILEAERRIGMAWKIELEARIFAGIKPEDQLLGGLRKDSHLTLRLARYF